MFNKTIKKLRRIFKRGTRKFSKLKCSPYQNKYVDGELKKYTCYTRNNLQLFKNVWNANNNNKYRFTKSEY